MPGPGMAMQRQEPLDPKKVGRKSHNKLNQNIKITIKLFKRPQIVQEHSNQASGNRNIFLGIVMKSLAIQTICKELMIAPAKCT